MSENWEEFMSKASDDLCRLYVRDWHMWSEEPVEAAIRELHRRGQTVSAETVKRVREGFKKRLEHEQLVESEVSIFNANHSWERNVTNNANAPELYSEKSILLLGIFFTVIISTYMLCLNMHSVKKKFAAWLVGLTGLSFWTLVMLMLMKAINKPTGGSFYLLCGANFLAILMLRVLFWSRFIGANTEYRPRSTTAPIALGVALMILAICLYCFSS